jgi:hypothetical protein
VDVTNIFFPLSAKDEPFPFSLKKFVRFNPQLHTLRAAQAAEMLFQCQLLCREKMKYKQRGDEFKKT